MKILTETEAPDDMQGCARIIAQHTSGMLRASFEATPQDRSGEAAAAIIQGAVAGVLDIALAGGAPADVVLALVIEAATDLLPQVQASQAFGAAQGRA